MCNVGRVRGLGECRHGADMSSTGWMVSRKSEDYMGKGAGGLALRRQAGVSCVSNVLWSAVVFFSSSSHLPMMHHISRLVEQHGCGL